MGEDMDIVVGVKVETSGSELQSQLDRVNPRPNVKAGVILEPQAGQDVAKQMNGISSAKIRVKPSVNLTEFENAIKSNIRRMKAMPTVHVQAEIDPSSLEGMRSSLRQMVNEITQNTPTLRLGNLLGGPDDAQQLQQQANQLQRAANQVSRTLQGLDRVQYNIAPNQQELKNQLLQFGMPERDVDAVVKQIEAGGFKIAQARARFAQRVMRDEDGNRTLTGEQLQSVSIAGMTPEGVSAVKTLTWNEQAGEYAMSTQLGMTLSEQGKVIKAGDQAIKQQQSINNMIAKLNELEAQAFSRRQPIQGQLADSVGSMIEDLRIGLANGSDVAQLQSDLKALETVIKDAKAAQKAVNELGDISVSNKYRNTEESMVTRAQEMNQLVGQLNADGLIAEATKMQSAFDAMRTAFLDVGRFGEDATGADWDAYTRAAKNYEEAVTQATNAQKRFATQQTAVDNATVLQKSLQDAGLATQAAELQQALNRVNTAAQALQASTDPGDLQEYAEAMKQLVDATKQYNGELQVDKQTHNMSAQLEKLRQNVAKIRNEWSKAMSKPENVQWLGQIEQAAIGAVEAGNKINFDRARQQLQVFQATMKATGQATETFGAKLKRLASEFTQWFSVSQVLMKTVNVGKQMISDVTDINSSMTDLKKVTDETASSYEQFSDRAVAQAKDLKTAITDVVDATAGWSRVGYGLDTAEALGEWSIIYANVGDDVESVDAATKSLISTLKGFGTEGNTVIGQAERIVDIYNKLGNNTSISSGQLGESLQHSASALSEANNSLAESSALTVGAFDVLQNAAEVGNMWKTVSMRIRGAKVELEAAGEDTEGMVESTSKLREQIKAMTGFDIMASADEFKSTYDTIVGIGEVWDSLADIEQASLLELLAGKNRGNALAAALKNVDAIKEAYEMATESAGSATAEYSVFEQSVQAHAQRMEASIQAFSKSVLAEDLIKFGYDSFSGILDGLTEITDQLGSIPSLATAAATAFTLFTGKGRSIVIYAPSGLNTLAA